MKIKSLGLTVLCSLLAWQAPAIGQDAAGEPFRFHKLPRRLPTGQPVVQPAPAPMPAPVAAAPVARTIPQVTTGNTAYIDTDLVRVEKTAPASAAIGEDINWNYRVISKTNNKEVVVTDYIPAGMELVSSDPQAQVDGNRLTWVFNDMAAGQTQNIKVVLRANQVGNMTSCFTVTAVPQACLTTVIGKPEIAIAKTGPAEALLNSDVTYTVTVSNKGNYPLRNVVVTDTLPAGLQHSSGQSTLSFNVGDLAGGESRQIPVTVKAVARGEHCNVAVAKASNSGQVEAQACTVVKTLDLTIAKTTTTPKQKVGKRADYQIVVTNPGDVTLTNVIVQDSAPPHTRIIEAPGAQVSGNIAQWTIARLEPGGQESFSVVLTSNTNGRHCNRAVVQGPNGMTKNAEACTDWVGQPAILLELIDTEDALLVGDSTTYIVRVTNQGTAPDANVTVTLDFPAGIDPVSASGATQGTVTGKNVSFAPYATFRPKEVIEFRIPAKASGEGDNRVKVTLKSQLLQDNPVIEDESTTVY